MCVCTIYVHRNNSTKDLESFAETAISINRMMQQHLIISGAPSFYVGGSKPAKVVEESSGDDDENHSDNDLDSGLSFDFKTCVKLSPPGLSALAKRRGNITHASAICNTGNSRRPVLPLRHSAMGSVDSIIISSGSWQWGNPGKDSTCLLMYFIVLMVLLNTEV